MKPKTSINVATWLFQSTFIIIVTIGLILFCIAESDAQISFKVRPWSQDKWRIDKAKHAAKGLVVSGLTDFSMKKKWLPENMLGLPSILVFGYSESIAFEIWDGLRWKTKGGAEINDALAGIAGTTLYWATTKMNPKYKTLTFSLIIFGFFAAAVLEKEKH